MPLCRNVRSNAGLFGFLGGGNAGSGKSIELVDDLLDTVSSSGLKTASSEDISSLVCHHCSWIFIVLHPVPSNPAATY